MKADGLAALQVVSGLFNLLVMSWTASLVFGAGSAVLGTLATCGCPVGAAAGLCGLWSLALIPLGLLEVVTGVLALSRRPQWAWLAPLTATAEIASLAFGGVGSFVVGLVAMGVLRDENVQERMLDDSDPPQLP